MAIALLDTSGNIVNAKPMQVSPEGLNTGLPTSSTALGGDVIVGGNYAKLWREHTYVATAVEFIRRQFIRPTLKVYERDSQGNRKRVYDTALGETIRRPMKGKGPNLLKQAAILPALIHGNGLVKIVRPRAGGQPIGYYPMRWRDVQPKIEDGEIVYWIWAPGGDWRNRTIVMPEDVLHLAWHNTEGPVGVSPLAHLGVTLTIEARARRYQEASLRNGARPSGGVTMPEAAITEDAELFKLMRANLRDDLDRLHAGEHNAGRPMIMPPGSKWQAFAHSATELDLIEQRKLSREEVAAVYQVPQPFVGILDHATYSNLAETRQMIYGEVLQPWFTLFEESFKAQVIDQEPAWEGLWVEFDLTEVLRGDPVKEAVAMKTRASFGTLTINEARAYWNLPPIDHPDANRPMILAGNERFVGGTGSTAGQPQNENTDSPGDALAKNLKRASDRLYRKAKAGTVEVWDADRFKRELAADLEAAKATEPEATAEAWTGALSAIVEHAAGDAETLRRDLAVLEQPVPQTTA